MPSAPKWLFDVVERLSPKLPSVEVADIQLLSPVLKKICFKGDFKNMAFITGCYIDFRVTDTDVRRYSPCNVDTENGYFELIAYLHGNGPGCKFMDALKIGEQVTITQPRGHKYYDASVDSYVIFGDETSLGLACSFMRVLKQNGHGFQFYLELDEENKEVPRLLNLENYSVFPKNGLFKKEGQISSLPFFKTSRPDAATFVLTGNAKSAQTFRKALKGTTGRKVFVQGYWLEGKKGL